MNKKQIGIFSPIILVLIIANLIFLNLWTSKLFGRLDLTENKIYTLSDVTKDVIRELEEPLTVKAYFTKDLPSPYNSIATYVEDQLAEMKAFGGGKFRFEFLDPEDEEDLKKEAQNFKLEPIQVNEVRADRVQYKLAYMGMVLIYEDRQEVIPMVQSLENLEYEILSKIKRVTTSNVPVIGFLEGHGEPKLQESMTRLEMELKKLYDIKQVSLSGRSSVQDDIDLLCIIGPKEDIPEADRFLIDQYIMSGGRVMMAINKVEAEISQMQAKRSALRIDPWTENYGFRIEDNLVLDRNAPTLPFQTVGRFGRQITMVVYPLFPEIINFNRDNLAMAVMRQVRLYFPSSIDTVVAMEKDSVTITPFMYSSEKSSIQSEPYDINPLTQRTSAEWDQSSIPMAALVEGKFDSYWKDKEIPLNEDGEPISEDPIIEKSPDNKIFVIGDANFIQDQFLVPGLDNLTMMLNLIDWFVQDERLITIRSREVSSRPIGEVSDGTRRTVKYINMILPPVLVILFGLMRWRNRAARRKKLEFSSGSSRIGGDAK